jgi:acyl carrier protein
MTTSENLKQIVYDQIGFDGPLTDSTRFIEDMGIDSLDEVQMIMAVEEEFNIEIPDEDAEKCKTFGEALAYVTERIKK